MKHSFILFIILFFPVLSFAQDEFIIFNSADDYINVRVKPTEKIIKEVYKGDFLFGIQYSINDTNEKWYNAFEGVIHSGQVQITDRQGLLKYIQKVLPEIFNQIPNNTVKNELLKDNPWILKFTEKELKELNERSQYNVLAYSDKIEGVMWLINLINRKEYTYALNNAALFGYYETCKWLIENGADCKPKFRKVSGKEIASEDTLAIRDALYYSVIGANNINIAKLLLKNGAAVNNKYLDALFPRYILSNACEKGDIHVVKLLIDNGADVNIVEKDKSVRSPSALQKAIEGNRPDIVELLVENGANINYPIVYSENVTDLKESPKEFTWRLGYKEIYKYLNSKDSL